VRRPRWWLNARHAGRSHETSLNEAAQHTRGQSAGRRAVPTSSAARSLLGHTRAIPAWRRGSTFPSSATWPDRDRPLELALGAGQALYRFGVEEACPIGARPGLLASGAR
jgi:hypothetical protein